MIRDFDPVGYAIAGPPEQIHSSPGSAVLGRSRGAATRWLGVSFLLLCAVAASVAAALT